MQVPALQEYRKMLTVTPLCSNAVAGSMVAELCYHRRVRKGVLYMLKSRAGQGFFIL